MRKVALVLVAVMAVVLEVEGQENITRAALAQQEKKTGKQHPDYISILRKYTKKMSKFADSISVTLNLAAEVKELTKSVYGKYTIQYAEVLSEFINYNYNCSRFLWLDPLTCFRISKINDEIYDIIDKVYGSEYDDLEIMNMLAFCCKQYKNYDGALLAYEKGLAATLRVHGIYSLCTAGTLNAIANVYSLMGNTKKAIDYGLITYDVYKSMHKKEQWTSDDEEIKNSFIDKSLAKYYMLAGLNRESDSIINNQITFYGEKYGTTTLNYVEEHIMTLINTCVDCAYYDKAIQLGQALESILVFNDQIEQTERENLLESLLESMLLCKLHKDKNNDAYDYLSKLQTLKNTTSTEDAVDILDFLAENNTTSFALKIYSFAQYVIDNDINKSTKSSCLYSHIRLKKSTLYANIDDYQNAFTETDAACEKLREQLGDSSVEYAEAILYKVKYLYHCDSRINKDNQIELVSDFLTLRLFWAEKQTQQALQIFRKKLGDSHPLTAIAFQYLALFAAAKHDYVSAVEFGTLSAISWVFARNSIKTRKIAILREADYLECLSNLSLFFLKKEITMKLFVEGK